MRRIFVNFLDVPVDVIFDFQVQRLNEHSSGAFSSDLIESQFKVFARLGSHW
jgi:hypothetical protein